MNRTAIAIIALVAMLGIFGGIMMMGVATASQAEASGCLEGFFNSNKAEVFTGVNASAGRCVR